MRDNLRLVETTGEEVGPPESVKLPDIVGGIGDLDREVERELVLEGAGREGICIFRDTRLPSPVVDPLCHPALAFVMLGLRPGLSSPMGPEGTIDERGRVECRRSELGLEETDSDR
jgi:hypothetical protein